MDRFYWSNPVLTSTENFVVSQAGVGLYDGEEKTAFQDGTVTLTTHRVSWRDARDPSCHLSIDLKWVVAVNLHTGRLMQSPKIVVHLMPLTAATRQEIPPGPKQTSRENLIKLSFRQTGEGHFFASLQETLKAKCWEAIPRPGTAAGVRGIGGIERKRDQKFVSTDAAINLAFEDLEQLMSKAKEMVDLLQNISRKVQEKKMGDDSSSEGDKTAVSQDLVRLGIPDPVTRATHGNQFTHELARELATFLEPILRKENMQSSGLMTLADAYCRVNRARGMHLLSPEDMRQACQAMGTLNLPVRLKVFDSGVMVVQLAEHDDQVALKRLEALLKERNSISAEELARHLSISAVLAREQLILSETRGLTCRDDTIEGLRFFPNLFDQRCDN